MRSKDEVAAVLGLADQGLSASRIGRELGIPRRTVGEWLHGNVPRKRKRRRKRKPRPPRLDELPPEAYSYLLGLYLGDGYVATCPRTFQLRISLASRYGEIVEAAVAATRAVMPGHSVSVVPHPVHRCVQVRCYSCWWPTLLPQHGRGRKHRRRIALARWQRSITGAEPQAFIRGLIHSDGSRFIATVKRREHRYRYVRYSFSNRSEDIKAIFCEYLDLLGIAWTRPNDRAIQIARRTAVEALDEFVGPKR